MDGNWPGMETAMVVGGCWPAMDTAMVVSGGWPAVDPAMELMVAGQQWIQQWNQWLLASNGDNHGGWWLLASNGHSKGINGYWPAMEAANGWPAMEATVVLCSFAGQQWGQP